MAQNRLPPIIIHSPKDTDQEENGSRRGTSADNRLSAVREQRRRRNLASSKEGSQENLNTTQQRRSRSSTGAYKSSSEIEDSIRNDRHGQTNPSFDNRFDINNERRPNRRRRLTDSTNLGETNESNSRRPPRAARNQLNKKANNFVSNTSYLQGLEEDVIDFDDELEDNRMNDLDDQQQSNLSQKDLIERDTNDLNEKESNFKSVPTDQFYLELEKKFAIRKKEQYEKQKQERLAQMFELQLRELQKEDQKYQISTPRTALFTHKFIRVISLFIHGINVGFQFWQVILIYVINSSPFIIDKSHDSSNNSNYYTYLSTLTPLLVLFQNLAMPFHCLSYLFLVICIVDTMDRVDFTGMTLRHLIKCLSFQNQFWSIVFYAIALILSLTLIYIDETVYFTSYLNNPLESNDTKNAFANYINSGATVWKALSIARAALCLLAWFLFSIFIKNDRTCELLEKRDFSLLDDIATTTEVKSANTNMNDKNDIGQNNKQSSQIPKLPDIQTKKEEA